MLFYSFFVTPEEANHYECMLASLDHPNVTVDVTRHGGGYKAEDNRVILLNFMMILQGNVKADSSVNDLNLVEQVNQACEGILKLEPDYITGIPCFKYNDSLIPPTRYKTLKQWFNK